MKIVKLNIEDSHPFQAKILWLFYFSCVVGIYTLAFYTPKNWNIEGANNFSCSEEIFNRLNINCQPFDIEKNPVIYVYKSKAEVFDQFLSVQGMPFQTSEDQRTNSKIKLRIALNVFGLNGQAESPYPLVKDKIFEIEHNCENKIKGFCKSNNIFHIPSFNHTPIIAFVEFLNPQELKEASIVEYNLAFFSRSPLSTQIIISYRYFVLLVCLISIIQFSQSLKKMSKKNISKDQKVLWVIGWLSIGYNDPFYFFTLCFRNTITAYLSCIMGIAVFTSLTYFWMGSLEKIIVNRKKRNRINGIEKIYAAIFLAVVGLKYFLNTYHNLQNPAEFWDTEEFSILKLLVYLVNSFGAFWFVFRCINIYIKRETLLFREKMFVAISSFFIVSILIFVMTGGPQVYHNSTVRETIIYGFTNLYIVLLLYLYRPAIKQGIEMVQIEMGEDDAPQKNFDS